jgi:stage V sporulation protein SpoVS
MPITYDDTNADTRANDTHESSDNVPLYPRSWFESAYRGLKKVLVKPVKAIEQTLGKVQQDISKSDWSTILQGVLLVFFVYADLVGGINIISLVPGLIEWSVPPWLGEYSITVLAGTILSIIVAGMVMGEMFQKNDDEETNNVSTKTARIISIILLASSFLTVIGINLLKLPVFIKFFTEEAKATIEIISGIFLHVVVMFNAAMSTFLLDKKGREGLKIISLVILFPLYIIFGLLAFTLQILTSIGPISVDIVVRAIFVAMNILAYIVLAPLDMSVDLIGKLLNREKKN